MTATQSNPFKGLFDKPGEQSAPAPAAPHNPFKGMFGTAPPPAPPIARQSQAIDLGEGEPAIAPDEGGPNQSHEVYESLTREDLAYADRQRNPQGTIGAAPDESTLESLYRAPGRFAGGFLQQAIAEPAARLGHAAAGVSDALGATEFAESQRLNAERIRRENLHGPLQRQAADGGFAAGAGQLVGGLAPSAASLALTGGGSAPVLLYMGIQAVGGGSEEYRSMMEAQGLKPEALDAMVVGMGYGAIEVLSEKIGLDIVGKVGKKAAGQLGDFILRGRTRDAAGVISGLAINAGVEGIEEALNQLSQNALAQQFHDPNRSLMQGVPQAGAMGAAGGGLLTGPAMLSPQGRAAIAGRIQRPGPRERLVRDPDGTIRIESGQQAVDPVYGQAATRSAETAARNADEPTLGEVEAELQNRGVADDAQREQIIADMIQRKREGRSFAQQLAEERDAAKSAEPALEPEADTEAAEAPPDVPAVKAPKRKPAPAETAAVSQPASETPQEFAKRMKARAASRYDGAATEPLLKTGEAEALQAKLAPPEPDAGVRADSRFSLPLYSLMRMARNLGIEVKGKESKTALLREVRRREQGAVAPQPPAEPSPTIQPKAQGAAAPAGSAAQPEAPGGAAALMELPLSELRTRAEAAGINPKQGKPRLAQAIAAHNAEDQGIINPIDRSASQDEKVRQLVALTEANEPVIQDIITEIDAALGTKSASNRKTPANILGKANRPSIRAEKPWHDVEHVRDSLRFKTVVSSLQDIPDALGILRKRGIEIVKSDTAKLFHPKAWGWRFAGFDLRMPNGQIVEWYLPLKGIEAVKGEAHRLFEKWRNMTHAQIRRRRKDFEADQSRSRQIYETAFQSELQRMGFADSKAAEASWSTLAASLGSSTTSNVSMSSSGPTTPASPKRQTPATRRAESASQPSIPTSPLSGLRTTVATDTSKASVASRPVEVKAEGLQSGDATRPGRSDDVDATRRATGDDVSAREVVGGPSAEAQARIDQFRSGQRSGKQSAIRLQDQRTLEATYVAVEADWLTPSHDARRGFAHNELGDKNERPYHDKVEGKSSRETVERIASDPKPDLILSDSPTPIDGPPIVASDGTVFGGNARTMGMQLAYHRGGKAADTYRAAMAEAGSKFGVDVAGLKNPVIVRVVRGDFERGELSRVLNESLAAGRTAATDAVSRASKVSNSTASMIGSMLTGDDPPTLRELMADPKQSLRIVQAFTRDGVWSQADLDRFTDANRGHTLTDDGKLMIERTLMGRIIDDVGVMAEMTPGVKQRVIAALPELIQAAEAQPEVKRILQDAIRAYRDYKASDLPPQDFFFNQQTMAPAPGFGDKGVAALVDALDRMGPRAFKSAAAELPTLLGAETADTAFAFATPKKAATVADAFAEAFAETGPASRRNSGTPPGARRGMVLVPNTPGTIRRAWIRNMTAAGNLPGEVHAAKIENDGWTNSMLTQTRYTLRDFASASKEAYGRKRLSAEEQESIDAVLRGDATPDTLPEPMREVVSQMRFEIDALSRRMIDLGVVEGELAAKVDSNLGVYLTRSYRVFDDPKWAAKVPVEIRNKAKALLRSEYPDKSEAQIEGLIESLLFEGKAAESPIAVIKGSKLGAKDLSILTTRKTIAPEIRALWGEYKDPRQNYARSVAKMAHLVGNHQFLTEVRADGLGKHFHESPIVIDGEAYKTRIAADESNVMHPLNGLYTTPEIKTAFEEALDPKIGGWALRAYMTANGLVKYGKTVLSPMTHVRNVIGNASFAVANGHWRVWKLADGIKTVATSLGLKNDVEWRDYYRTLLELGVVNESVRANELHDVIRDASKKSVDELLDMGIASLPQKAARVLTSIYRAEDDLWKVFAYENELARYKKAWAGRPIEEIEARAAEIVRNTYPTYSMIGRAVKAVRRFPLVGTFVSFPAEVARTGYHTLRYAAEELKDPATRGIGAQRLTGIVAAATATSAASIASRLLMGVSDDEDEDVRRFLPPWSQNSQLVYVGRSDNGNLLVIDVGYSDPHAYLKNPAMALLRGESWTGAMWQAFWEAAEPFAGEEILAGKLGDIRANRTASGAPIWNEQDELHIKAMAAMSHVWDAFEPGAVTSAKRVYRGLTGYVSPYGRGYDPKVEALAVFTGQRIMEIDVRQSLAFKASRFNRSSADATSLMSSVVGRRGTVKANAIFSAYGRMEHARQKLWDEIREDARAAIRLGIEPHEVGRTLIDAGVSRENAVAILKGQYAPYRPTPQLAHRIREAATELASKPGQRTAEEIAQERARIIREQFAKATEAAQAAP